MPFEVDNLAPFAPPQPRQENDAGYQFEGHVDFFGYHAQAKGWIFGGWITHPWPPGDHPGDVLAHFSDGIVERHELSTFHYREDVLGRGIGFVFLLRADRALEGTLQYLEVRFQRTAQKAYPTHKVELLDQAGLARELEHILARSEASLHRRRLLDLVARGRPDGAVRGFIDYYGYHDASGGWLFSGWADTAWWEDQRLERVAVSFEQGVIEGRALGITFPRPDLGDGGEGVMLFVHGPRSSLGALCMVSFEVDGNRFALYPGAPVTRLREQDVTDRSRQDLLRARQGHDTATFLSLVNRRPYQCEDTIAALSDPVLMAIDEAIVCGSDGLALMGWHLAKSGVVAAIRVRCGPVSAELDLAAAIRVDRGDVLTAFSASHGFDNPDCGFIAFVPLPVKQDDRCWLEIQTTRGEVGYLGLPRSKLRGMTAMRRILESFDVRFGDLPRAFDLVAGPALALLNRDRLNEPNAVEVMTFGAPPVSPRHSVIVPLFGRIDFVEYQMAFFSGQVGASETEFIYVLDDPSLRREARVLCESVYSRFGVSFRLLLLDRNVGFAPANNIGLRYATGEYIAFLNSDAFPESPDWIERLTARLEFAPEIGVIGPLLLFEDGSVQHQGIAFRRLREFGDWFFAYHDGKGMRPPAGGGLRERFCITGACMVMRRDLALRIGGFDETFAIGDFEDTDLCLKLRALGYTCAVDLDARLYHLERKSQISAAANWRMNLTLFNAWQHQRRWYNAIAEQIAAEAGGTAWPRPG